MLCKTCETKPLFRGIKKITCFRCGEEIFVNSAFTNICTGCAEMNGLCEYCGETIKKESE